MNQFRIPHDHPIRFLPLVYFLPAELLAAAPTLRTLPRCFSEVAKSETHIATIESDQFLNEIVTPRRGSCSRISAFAVGSSTTRDIPRRGSWPMPPQCGQRP